MSELDDKVKERAGPRSFASFGFSMEGGRGKCKVRVDPDDVNAAIKLLIGDVERMTEMEVPNNTGRLHRSLPASFPRFPELYCERIEDGIGVAFAGEEAAPTLGLGNNWQNFGRYKCVEFDLSFLPRPYDLLTDDEIEYGTVDWTDADGTLVTSKWTQEWKRWTDIDVVDTTELLTADQGAMYIAVDDTAISPQQEDKIPHGCEFPGKPSMPLQEDTMVITWFGVPYSYWSSTRSVLRKYKFRINDRPFMDYASGELCYMGAKPRKYGKPYPRITVAGNVVAVRQKKLCDLTMTFKIRQQRIAGSPTNVGNKLFNSAFNCAPVFLDKKWYSIIMSDPQDVNNVTKWHIVHDSFPMEILFADPDA